MDTLHITAEYQQLIDAQKSETMSKVLRLGILSDEHKAYIKHEVAKFWNETFPTSIKIGEDNYSIRLDPKDVLLILSRCKMVVYITIEDKGRAVCPNEHGSQGSLICGFCYGATEEVYTQEVGYNNYITSKITGYRHWKKTYSNTIKDIHIKDEDIERLRSIAKSHCLQQSLAF